MTKLKIRNGPGNYRYTQDGNVIKAFIIITPESQRSLLMKAKDFILEYKVHLRRDLEEQRH